MLKNTGLHNVRSSWTRYLVLLAGLSLLFVVALIAVWPSPYALAVERLLLPQYEASFGFRGGQIPLRTGGGRTTIYGLVAVLPRGKLALAGAKVGDIPVDYHGGIWAFYGALQEASSGRAARFAVLAEADWPDWEKRREIVLTVHDRPTRD